MQQKPDMAGLQRFLTELPWREMEQVGAPFFHLDAQQAAAFLDTLQAEAKLGFHLIGEHLGPGVRVLEVGSGMGLLAGYLRSCGLDVVALEPGLGGFGISGALTQAIAAHPAYRQLERLDEPAEALQPEKHGLFDLIYSVNVLEHIPALDDAVRAMGSVLRPGGKMIHACPNYTIPYEPHFGIPLIPFVPRATELFVPKLRASELWQSLNFITARALGDICHRNGLRLRLAPGVMYAAFERLESDSEFRRRQSNGFVRAAFAFLQKSGLLRLLRQIPASCATPMIAQMYWKEADRLRPTVVAGV